ncbi:MULTISPECIES: cyclodeaminase/cyclohydrolase family protein [Cetobacterium]|jgi:formiminotetrahydrofolate cyclodeaminase|uniref:Cyclodeaminase/cyclohydrolase family protein n=1 Tax=Candidatus Cetobacterium colombiensis TaxID=3073100 RepID=A0ABU4W8L6_9FUSO|nr:cyclodeaminase/cyclohydrolase family protein [Candidatus Cetobacterium colombiensis]MDX8335034.1 cyclodeaminase/cyclohydrolase family protein [Candidatus Cetobacterium colombiensis]
MKLVDLSVKDFLNIVDSKSPAPGGGSVSALASSLGCTLARMVAHLTFDKKKYKDLSELEKEVFLETFEEIDKYRKILENLIDKDTEAYNLVMAGYKLPKETEEEKEIRSIVIEKNLKLATDTPLEICRISEKTLKLLKIILKYGNKNAITDLGVSAILLYSGIEGGVLNVKINLASLNDETFKIKTLNQLDEILITAKKLKKEILDVVNESL